MDLGKGRLLGRELYWRGLLIPEIYCKYFEIFRTSSTSMPNSSAACFKMDSVANMPWGAPKPRNAVFEAKLVRHRWPNTSIWPKRYTLSMWANARSAKNLDLSYGQFAELEIPEIWAGVFCWMYAFLQYFYILSFFNCQNCVLILR